MAGINSIVDYYKKHGEDGLKTVLSNDVRITEKYDAFRFSFEKTDKGFVFFGKNGNSALSHIDRTISNLYETAIAYIDSLPYTLKSQIPKGQRFGFYFFPNNKPLKVEYNKMPKNGLVLTDLTIRRGDRIAESITNYDILKRWSNVLNTDCDKPLFEGKLENTELVSILESVKQGSNVNKLFENSSNTNSMEGVIIQCSTDKGIQLLKFDDPQFVNESTIRKREHIFDLLLMSIYEYIETHDLPKVVTESRTDDRYLSIVCEMFNSYVQKYGNDFLSMNLKKPSFLEKSGSFTHDWIKDKQTLKILEVNRNYEYLLSIFITNLRKEKKSSGLLTESLTKSFNEIVNDIQELSKGSSDEYAHLEFGFLTETDTHFVNNQIVEETEEAKPAEDNIHAISLMQRVFSSNESKEKPGKETVNVLLGNYTLFTNADLDEAEALFKRTGKRVVIVHVSQNKKSGLKFEFENVKVIKMLSKLVDDNDSVLAGCELINAPLISQVLTGLRPKFEPTTISVNDSIKSLEIEYASRKWLNTNYPKDLEFFSYSSHIQKIYDILEKGSVADFSKLVPEPISKYFMEYQSEYRKFIYVT